jgi:Tol biopolymer transport system component
MMVVKANGTGLRPAGVPGTSPAGACALPGSRVAYLASNPANGELSAIFVSRLYGRGGKRVTPWETHADKIDCSPDGQRIVFSKPAFGEGGKSSNVYTMPIDGLDLVQLTHETGGGINAGADAWSPDGMKIAYVSNKADDAYQIWTMNADGSGATQVTHADDAHLADWGTRPLGRNDQSQDLTRRTVIVQKAPVRHLLPEQVVCELPLPGDLLLTVEVVGVALQA